MKFVVHQVPFPPWAEFEARVTADLEVDPGESATFVYAPVLLELPEAFVKDCEAAAARMGKEWTIGRVLSYLVLQGTLRLAEQAHQRETS